MKNEHCYHIPWLRDTGKRDLETNLKEILSVSFGQLKHQTLLELMNPKFVLLYSPLFSYYLEIPLLPLLQISLHTSRFCLRLSIIVFLFLPTSFIFLHSCLSLKPLPPTPGFNFHSVLLSHNACLLFQFLLKCFVLPDVQSSVLLANLQTDPS